MTSPSVQLQPPLSSRTVCRTILCLYILVAIWVSLTREELGDRKGFKFAPLASIRNAEGIPRRGEVPPWNWSTESVSSALGRLLLGEGQHLIVIGLLNEDGAISSEVISSRKFTDQDGWEEDMPAGEVARRHQQKPDVAVMTFQFEMCPPKLKNYIPCLDDVSAINQLPDATKGEQCDCPHQASRICCIIATPSKYKMPIRWPRSKDEVWVANVPRPRRGWNESWITTPKDKFWFPTTGLLWPNGMNGYVDQLAQMVPELEFGVRTRTALDVGCGVGSFGAALLAHGVLPLSIAAKASRKDMVQLALERGVPAMVAALATHRLLFPSQVFDLVHCSDCEVEWTSDGGMLLIEADRVLSPGGYFAWTATLDTSHAKRNKRIWHDMQDLAERLCWTLVAKEGYLAVWQKPDENSCYQERAQGTLPPMCDESNDPDAVWNVLLKQCVSWLPAKVFKRNSPEWPARLSSLPERRGVSLMYKGGEGPDVFVAKQRHWNEIVSGYLRGLGLKNDRIRNVMDMRAGYGGFAAALVGQHVDCWVMNVVPSHEHNSLSVIYDRGLLGVVHDWCEPFNTYPRTYDLLHAAGLFSAEEQRCSIAHIVLEMDRILRPGGWVLIRESISMASKVEALAKSQKWKTRILETESGPHGKDKLLFCIKQKR